MYSKYSYIAIFTLYYIKLSSLVGALHSIVRCIPQRLRYTIYNSLVKPHLLYLIEIWGSAPKTKLSQLQITQNKLIKMLFNYPYLTATTKIYKDTKLMNIKQLYTYNICIFIKKVLNKTIHSNITLTQHKQVTQRSTRRASLLVLPKTYIKHKRNSRAISKTMKLGNETVSDGGKISNMFSKYFASVFVEESADPVSISCDLPLFNQTLSTVSITESKIYRKLINLDRNKGAGPDAIPPCFIRDCAKALVVPLHIIFNTSLSSGVFPARWKLAHIVPIHKAGDISDCSNYRPISILSTFAKVFESLVYDQLYYHIQPFIRPEQHGFVKGKSTVSNLLEYTSYISEAFNDHVQVDCVYTDFRKAFDRVNHRMLLCKLDTCWGIHGSLLRWLESYIVNRSQIVTLGSYNSDRVSIPSGVPQGSHLGPLFFILYINDLIPKLLNHSLLYADDLKIFSRVGNVTDCNQLQSDINTLLEWCALNGMDLSVNKCSVITFTRAKNPITFEYTANDHILQRLAEVRDLGVIYDSKLSSFF